MTVRNDAPPSGLPSYVIGNTSGLPEGTSKDILALYSPHTPRVDRPIDGAPATAAAQVEFGGPVYSTSVQVPPGGYPDGRVHSEWSNARASGTLSRCFPRRWPTPTTLDGEHPPNGQSALAPQYSGPLVPTDRHRPLELQSFSPFGGNFQRNVAQSAQRPRRMLSVAGGARPTVQRGETMVKKSSLLVGITGALVAALFALAGPCGRTDADPPEQRDRPGGARLPGRHVGGVLALRVRPEQRQDVVRHDHAQDERSGRRSTFTGFVEDGTEPQCRSARSSRTATRPTTSSSPFRPAISYDRPRQDGSDHLHR